MPLFSANKEGRVRGLMVKLANSNCPDLRPQIEDPRLETRVNVTVVVAVIPLKEGRIQIDDGFTAVTKDISSVGVALVLEHPLGLDKVILGFRIGEEMSFALAEAKHLNPMGGGFFQLGFRLLEVVSAGDYPGLGSVTL